LARNNEACADIPDIESNITRLNNRIQALDNDTTDSILPCMRLIINNITKETCIDGIDIEKHKGKYRPFASCSHPEASNKHININFDDNTIDSKCWSINKLKPIHDFTFIDGAGDLDGAVGVLGENSPDEKWDKDEECTDNDTTLHKCVVHLSYKASSAVFTSVHKC